VDRASVRALRHPTRLEARTTRDFSPRGEAREDGCVSLALALPVVLSAACPADPPVSDPNAYVRRLVGVPRQDEALSRYTYDVTETREDLDRQGRVERRRTRAYEVFHVRGRPIRKLVARDGKPLPPGEREKEERRARELTEAIAAGRAAREQSGVRLSRILERYNFQSSGREEVNGRCALGFDFRARARCARDRRERLLARVACGVPADGTGRLAPGLRRDQRRGAEAPVPGLSHARDRRLRELSPLLHRDPGGDPAVSAQESAADSGAPAVLGFVTVMRRHSTRLSLASVALLVTACGGNGSPPTAPATPPPLTYSVTATVFYDEDGNGRLDGQERVRVPGVEVVIGSAAARSAPATGQAIVSGIPEGPAAVGVRLETLPAYFQPRQMPAIQVPGPAEVQIPLTLPIGNNHPNLYLGYGDSITAGDGSSDEKGYVLRLQALLVGQVGRADVRAWGREGDTSQESSEVALVRKTLRWYDPAYTLILLGTNDWHKCKSLPPTQCFTIDSLRTVVETVKDWQSLPVLATITPANPAIAPASRNKWIDDMNALIKALARQENVAVADLNAEFKAAGNLASLFSDDVHPNDAGYQVLAQGWTKGITGARSTTASSRHRFGFSLGR
jgi:lysophospholipase L1-like esterase